MIFSKNQSELKDNNHMNLVLIKRSSLPLNLNLAITFNPMVWFKHIICRLDHIDLICIMDMIIIVKIIFLPLYHE